MSRWWGWKYRDEEERTYLSNRALLLALAAIWGTAYVLYQIAAWVFA